MTRKRVLTLAGFMIAGSAIACGGGGSDADANEAAPTPAAATSDAPTPQPTGTVIEVKMITDDLGNYFEPSTIEARPGDVIRFVLVSGVHNVSMPADRNPAGVQLVAPSDLLQLPGQSWDLNVTMPAGEYFFQCDPHAALGMVGTITVVD